MDRGALLAAVHKLQSQTPLKQLGMQYIIYICIYNQYVYNGIYKYYIHVYMLYMYMCRKYI